MSKENEVMHADDLTRSFADGGRQAMVLQGVSVALRRSQVVLLMGPSGSGKSTLLAILSGLLAPTSGKVAVQGEDLWGSSERRRERIRRQYFGFVFQGCNLFPALTALQQLEIVLRWWGGATGREARRRSEQMLCQLGLSKQLHRRPAELSGGEKQRVAIGRALVKEPEICFADEPTSALDWTNGEQVVQLLRETALQQKAAVLIVSHDERIKPYADRVLEMSEGRLLEKADALSVPPCPVHPCVPEFVL